MLFLQKIEHNYNYVPFFGVYWFQFIFILRVIFCKILCKVLIHFLSLQNEKITFIACGDDLNVRKMNINNKVIYYGFNDNNDVIAKNINLTKIKNLYT